MCPKLCPSFLWLSYSELLPTACKRDSDSPPWASTLLTITHWPYIQAYAHEQLHSASTIQHPTTKARLSYEFFLPNVFHIVFAQTRNILSSCHSAYRDTPHTSSSFSPASSLEEISASLLNPVSAHIHLCRPQKLISACLMLFFNYFLQVCFLLLTARL